MKSIYQSWSSPCHEAEQRRHQPITSFVYWCLCDVVHLLPFAMTLSMLRVPPPGCSKTSVWQHLILDIRKPSLIGCRIIMDIPHFPTADRTKMSKKKKKTMAWMQITSRCGDCEPIFSVNNNNKHVTFLLSM